MARAIVAAASRWRAELLHPGYGYLSEKPSFAAAVERAGIRFVGPTAESMHALGGKEAARAAGRPGWACRRCRRCPRRSSRGSAPAEWPSALAARGIAPPYLVKAAGGGGGKGMRLVADAADLQAAVARAAEEARAAFADGTVFVERFLEAPRHVEIQVFGDGRGGGVFWGERECSLQRRHQKLFEEAPSSAVTPALRESLGRAALALVRAARYRGAGTVEFLLDPRGPLLLPRGQHAAPGRAPGDRARVRDRPGPAHSSTWPRAAGRRRSRAPGRFRVPTPRGQAFEARVLAEDPRRGFLPAPGLVRRYHEPSGDGVRVDSGIAARAARSPRPSTRSWPS